MKRKRKRLFWWLAISIWLFSFYLAEAAWAEDYYFPAQDITTNQTNTSIDAIAKTANSGPEPPLASDPGVYITNVVIDGTLKSGDYVTVIIKDWQGNQQQQNFSSLPINYSPPAGAAYYLNYTLHTSSTPGWRQTYYVQATNNLGVVSHWETPAPPPADDTTPPAAPTGVQAVAESPTDVNITWNANPDAFGYYVYRDGTLIADVMDTSYLDIGLTPGTTYTYTVRAYDAAGNLSAPSAPATVTTPTGGGGGDTTPPEAPTGVQATADSPTQVTVTWNANTEPDIAGYKVYVNGVLIAVVTGTSYTDTGLTPGTTYTYTVRAFDTSYNLSAWSAPATVTTPTDSGGEPPPPDSGGGGGQPPPEVDTTPPAAPTGVQATADGCRVIVTWDANNEPDVAGYKVYRDGTLVANVTGTSYTDTGLTAGKTYTYTVRAYDAAGNVSDESAPATVTTPCLLGYLQNPPPPPAPPSPPSISIPPAGTFDGTGPGYSPPNIAIPPPPSFNPAPPTYSPPAGRGPFIYEPPDFAVPAPIESPPPLPPIPNPEDYLLPTETPLPQQPPRQQDPVSEPQPPLARQEPHQDPPLARQEPHQDPPLARQEPHQDPPLARDPVLSRQTPLTPEQPLTPEPALARQAPGSAEPPLARQAPLAQDAPLTRDAPLQPEPPLTATPPLGS